MSTVAMTIFRNPRDRAPIAIIAGYFALDVAVYFAADSRLFVLAWMVVGIIPKACVCAWNHHHQHVPTFRSRALNRALEFVYGLQTGLVSHGWTLHHVIGHHRNYLDQTRDESRWKTRSGRRMGVLEYSFSVALTAYPRALRVGRRFPRQRGVLVRALVYTSAALAAAFAYDPFNATFVFILPMALSLLITSWATYAHHSGLETDDHFQASHNVLHHWYNVMTGNLGYHTAHHYKCAVHWSDLPALHEQIRHRIPAHCYVEPGIPFCWLDGRITGGAPVEARGW